MRTWFQWTSPYRAVRGGVVIELQIALSRAGHLASVDGVYAGQTAQGVKACQASKGQTPSGVVDELAWEGLTGTVRPSLFRRCLTLTAAFEGHGYTLAVGNFDGAFLTWGIIGFTLKSGSLGKVIARVHQRHPALLPEVLGSESAAELLRIVGAKAAEQKAWADALSLGVKKYDLRTDWRDGFEALGNLREVRTVQDEVAHDLYWIRAVQDLKAYGARTERDAALFYDTAVQNGGIGGDKIQAVKSAVAGVPAGATNSDRLCRIGDAIAATSSERYREDVRSRRASIARGTGQVHGADYRLAGWGLDDLPITDLDLL